MISQFDRLTMLVMVLASAAGVLMWLSRGLFHYFQLESYQFKGYFRTLKRQASLVWYPLGLYAAAAGILFFISRLLSGAPAALSALFRFAASAALVWAAFRLGVFSRVLYGTQKKPFARTDRIRRL